CLRQKPKRGRPKACDPSPRRLIPLVAAVGRGGPARPDSVSSSHNTRTSSYSHVLTSCLSRSSPAAKHGGKEESSLRHGQTAACCGGEGVGLTGFANADAGGDAGPDPPHWRCHPIPPSHPPPA
ncbi:hypothetical protein BHM03_00054118, partial [Ensete ventricosum]